MIQEDSVIWITVEKRWDSRFKKALKSGLRFHIVLPETDAKLLPAFTKSAIFAHIGRRREQQSRSHNRKRRARSYPAALDEKAGSHSFGCAGPWP